jgi:hypothetical protein
LPTKYNIPQINQWYLEAKDFLKNFVKITSQVKQEKDLKSNGKNEDKEHL